MKTPLKTPLLAVAGLLFVSSAAHAANAKICFEAEKYATKSGPFKTVAAKGVSGTGYMEIPWDRNVTKGKGSATYRFTVAKPGIYSVWARAFWANGCGNSVGVSVNNGPTAILGEDGTYEEWHWIGGRARVKLNAGVNTLVLKNTETGPRVDQFFLCQDAGYTPVNIRKTTQ